MALIDVASLSCVRGGRLVFQNISFALSAGEVLIVTGANGAGKSSLLRAIAGLLRLESGTIACAVSIAYLGHQDGLKTVESPRESISFRAAVQGNDASPDGALAAMGLADLADTRQLYLSAGQRRRTALAGVIATGGGLWLLDEPTAALDADGKTRLLAALERHRADGGMAIVTTHETLEIRGAKELDLDVIPAKTGIQTRLHELAITPKKQEIRQAHVRQAEVLRLREKDWIPIFAGMTSIIILVRDLRLVLRQSGQIVTTLLFFLLVIMVLALGVGPDAPTLRGLAPGSIWTAALLASLLSLDHVFAADAEDGSLDQLRAGAASPEGLALQKMAAHFLTTGVPLSILTPLAAFFLALPASTLPVMTGALLIGTALFSLIGGTVAALLVGARRGGLLSALLTLPLYVPVLIFGSGAVEKSLAGNSPVHALLLLGALLALALPLAPIAAAAALEE